MGQAFPSGQPLNGTGTAAFVAKISPSGTLVYSSYIGGTSDQAFGAGLEIDSNANVYLVGAMAGADFPTFGAWSTERWQREHGGDRAD